MYQRSVSRLSTGHAIKSREPDLASYSKAESEQRLQLTSASFELREASQRCGLIMLYLHKQSVVLRRLQKPNTSQDELYLIPHFKELNYLQVHSFLNLEQPLGLCVLCFAANDSGMCSLIGFLAPEEFYAHMFLSADANQAKHNEMKYCVFFSPSCTICILTGTNKNITRLCILVLPRDTPAYIFMYVLRMSQYLEIGRETILL